MRAALIFALILSLNSFGLSASNTQLNNCTGQWREVDWEIVPFIELNSRYFSYQFKIPAGKKLQFKIDGAFPVARYMSFHVYDQLTEDPISRLADSFIPPAEGSVNPYQPQVDRYSTNRTFSFSISQLENTPNEDQILWIPFDKSQDRYIDIWYRVYVSEEKDISLPQIHAFDMEGQEIKCPEPHLKTWSIATEPGPLNMRIPAPNQENKIPRPFKNGDVHFFKPSTSSLGANLDNKYLSTRLDGKALYPANTMKGRIERRLLNKHHVINNIGDLTVLRFKIPTFPDTQKKLKYFSGKEDVRYWSICLSEADTSTEACLMDSQVKTLTGDHGEQYAIMVVGPNIPQLKSQILEKHYNFMSHSNLRAPILFFRQLLARPDFEGSLDKVTPISSASSQGDFISDEFFGETAIRDYSPVGRQCWYDPTQVSSLCGLTD